jgi:hypothetical protein
MIKPPELIGRLEIDLDGFIRRADVDSFENGAA